MYQDPSPILNCNKTRFSGVMKDLKQLDLVVTDRDNETPYVLVANRESAGLLNLIATTNAPDTLRIQCNVHMRLNTLPVANLSSLRDLGISNVTTTQKNLQSLIRQNMTTLRAITSREGAFRWRCVQDLETRTSGHGW